MSKTHSTHIGCSGTTIFIVFLVLKLTGVIDWSWWWITAPLWISFAFMLIILAIVLLAVFLLSLKK